MSHELRTPMTAIRGYKGYAELLGGSIAVKSEVGKGSTFTVRVPVVYKG